LRCVPRGEERGAVAIAASRSIDLSTRSAFTRTVAGRLSERIEGLEAREFEEALTPFARVRGGDQVELRLDRVWRLCLRAPAECDREVGLLGGAFRDSMTKQELTATRSSR
jgi:hypothetical protein